MADSIRDRYLRDPMIHALVSYLESAIASLQFTPTEIRECAMLAAERHEMRHTRPIMVPSEALDSALLSRLSAPRTEGAAHGN